MKDIENPKWMYLKAALFLLIGLVSAALIIAENPSLNTVVLLLLVVWSFSRAYYFAFYVIEKYVDPSFRFSGLASVAKYFRESQNR